MLVQSPFILGLQQRRLAEAKEEGLRGLATHRVLEVLEAARLEMMQIKDREHQGRAMLVDQAAVVILEAAAAVKEQ